MDLSKISFILGLLSIPFSIGIWFLHPDLSGAQFSGITDQAMKSVLISAHAERWGIFVGLWAPTLIGIGGWLKGK